MTRKPSTMTCLGALAVGLAAPAFAAQADDGSNEQTLKQELAELRAEVAELREGQQQTEEQRAEEVKTLIDDVVADSDRRSTWQAGNVNAGHDGDSFFLGSDDDRFRLNVGGQIQLRGIGNFRDDTTMEVGNQEVTMPGESSAWGFEVPRAKLHFSGHIGNPRLEYKVGIAGDLRDTPNTEQIFVEDAVISYELLDGISVWGGQAKAPYLREELVKSAHQLAVERSLVNQVFTVGRVQGVGVDAEVHEMVRVAGTLSNGIRSGEPAQRRPAGIVKPTMSNSRGFLGNNTDFALTGRADVKVAGEWGQADDFTAWVGDPMGVFVGAAGHFEKGRTGDDGVPNDDFWSWTVDGSVQHLGWSAYAAVNHLRTDYGSTVTRPDGSTGAENAEIWGILAQGSYNIDDTFEPFVRYEYLDLSGLSVTRNQRPADPYVNLVTAGVNWYHNQHNAKFTADVVWALDPVPGTGSLNTSGAQQSLLGLQNDPAGDDDQLAVRLQYQLLF